MKLRSFLLIFLAAISFAKGASRQSNLPITTTLNGADSSGLPADIQSDGASAYSDGVAGVTSFLTTNGYNGIVWGDWQFGTLNSTTRPLVRSALPEPWKPGGVGTGRLCYKVAKYWCPEESRVSRRFSRQRSSTNDLVYCGGRPWEVSL